MAAPLALAGPPIAKGSERLVKALTADLLVINHRVYRRIQGRVNVVDSKGEPLRTKSGRIRTRKVETFEPVDLELHINPVGIGVGAAALGVAALGAWVVWNGISVPSPLGGSITLFPGAKNDPDIQDRFKSEEEREEEAKEEAQSTASCSELQVGFNLNRGFDNFLFDVLGTRRIQARQFWDEAQRRGCDWITTRPRP